MLRVTQDLVLPTAITGSYPRPLWFDESLRGRSFKSALGDSIFREQYLDAVAAVINAQEAAGLDIVTDGDTRFDLAVGGKSWFFYPIERLGGIEGHRDERGLGGRVCRDRRLLFVRRQQTGRGGTGLHHPGLGRADRQGIPSVQRPSGKR